MGGAPVIRIPLLQEHFVTAPPYGKSPCYKNTPFIGTSPYKPYISSMCEEPLLQETYHPTPLYINISMMYKKLTSSLEREYQQNHYKGCHFVPVFVNVY
ncbi:hypothetical protein FKM82_023929 [Ascaphus truei]